MSYPFQSEGFIVDPKATLQQIMREHKALTKRDEFKIFIDPKDPIIWHITYRGVEGTSYEGGLYHIVLNLKNYPKRPPHVYCPMETNTFYPNARICIQGVTLAGEETGIYYMPGTSIDAIIRSVQMYMDSPDRAGVGLMQKSEMTSDKAKRCATNSREYKCSVCGADHSSVVFRV